MAGDFTDFRAGYMPALTPGGKYELVYEPPNLFGVPKFNPDSETVRSVVARREGVAVTAIWQEAVGLELHVEIVVGRVALPSELVPVKIEVQPEGFGVVDNLATIVNLDAWQGVVELDRMRFVGAGQDFEEAERTESTVTARDEGPNVAQAVGSLSDALIAGAVVFGATTVLNLFD